MKPPEIVKGFILPNKEEWYSMQQMMRLLGRSQECVRLRVINGTIERMEWDGVSLYRLTKGVTIVRG